MKHLTGTVVALALALAACDGGGSDEPQPGAPTVEQAPEGTARPSAAQASGSASCDLAIAEVAAYQAVKIPLMREGAAVTTRNADLVEGRDALVRVFVRPGATWSAREVTVRLLLRTSAGDAAGEDRRLITASSNDGDLGTTFNFPLPAELVTGDARYRVEVAAPGGCATFPASGEATLSPKRTGTLKVRLVPIRYETDGSNRLPDTSEAQIERYRALLAAMFPVANVELSLREPVGTDAALMKGGWSDLLDALRALRAQDRPGPDVYYYGLVSPAVTFGTYCGSGCTAGIAYRASEGTAGLRVGVGVGFTGETAVQSLAHELGHQHGMAHAPCGAAADVDERYPYANGLIGSWGYDQRRSTFYDPGVYTDMMGYCRRSWISDYTYQALLQRSTVVNLGPTVQALTLEGDGAPARVLIVDAEGRTRWGHPFTGAVPPSAPAVSATIRDAQGQVVAQPTVRQLEHGDGDDRAYVVPPPEVGWHSVELPGGAPALFGDRTPPPLR